jgi:hypothetical protein
LTITLTAARTRVGKVFDDVDAKDATTSNVDDALKTEFHAVYKWAGTLAPRRFAKETASMASSSTGAVDLTSIAGGRILTVNYVTGTSRSPIPEAAMSSGPSDAQGIKNVKILYLPPLTFPTAPGNNFVWGQSTIDLPELDDLMCLRAASTCSVFLDDGNKQLEKLIARAEENLHRILNPGGGWRIMPLRGRSRDSGLAWVKTDDVTLQLVNARLSSMLVVA